MKTADLQALPYEGTDSGNPIGGSDNVSLSNGSSSNGSDTNGSIGNSIGSKGTRSQASGKFPKTGRFWNGSMFAYASPLLVLAELAMRRTTKVQLRST